MKHRLAKQIQQINEFMSIFRSSKCKCLRLIDQLNLEEDLLYDYVQVQKLFKIDLNILDMHHLRDRKSKLIAAIDGLNKLESKLSLRAIKQQAELQQIQEQQNEESKIEIHQSQTPQIFINKNPSHQSCMLPPTNFPKQISHKRRSAECEIKISSRCGELLNVWSKNRPQPHQNFQDKFDRLSKIIGILKKNAKQIFEEQKERNDALILQDSDQFSSIKQELYKLKKQNSDLKNFNTQLVSENNLLKDMDEQGNQKKKANQTMTQSKECQTYINPLQRLIEPDNFSRIMTIYNPETQYSIDSSRIQSKRDPQFFEGQADNSILIADSVQSSQDKDQPTCLNQNFYEQIQQNNDQGILTFNKRVNNEQQPKKPINTKELINVQSKLKQIKQNRKRITNDDDLWSQMENMKL